MVQSILLQHEDIHMELGDIRSTLLQLMKIIANVEKSVFLSDEQKMYATLFHSKTSTAFSNPNFAANKAPIHHLKQIFFGFLNDRRFSSNIQICKTFIKPHDKLWQDDDLLVEHEAIDPFMPLNNKVQPEQQKTKDKDDIDANDLRIYFACAFQCINNYLLSLNLVSEEFLQEEDNSLSHSDKNLSSDEESDSSVGEVISDNDEFSKNEINDAPKNNQVNLSPIKHSYHDAQKNVIYKFNLLELDRLHTRFDDPAEIEIVKAEIKTILIEYKKLFDSAQIQNKSTAEVIDEQSNQTTSPRI